MTDHRDHLDELTSAYLDGEVSSDEAARVESDPALLDRVEAMRAVRSALASGVRPDPVRREAAIAAALSAASQQRPPVAEITPARERRSPRTRILAVAAVVALFALGLPLLASLDDGRSDGAATASRSDETAAASQESDARPDAESFDAAEDAAGSSEPGAGPEPRGPSSGSSATTTMPAVIGRFDDVAALAAQLAGRAADDGSWASASALPGRDCSAVRGAELDRGAVAVLGDRTVTAFVISGPDDERLVVVDPANCTLVADRPL